MRGIYYEADQYSRTLPGSGAASEARRGGLSRMGQAKRILVVDDDPINRELLMGMLEALGHECETAADGLEALAKLQLEIDLVLLDVMMPGIDGYEVASRIRADEQYG